MIKNKVMTEIESKLNEKVEMGVEKGIETPWAIIESYFKDQHLAQLVRHQIESYNNFVNYQIQKTIDMFNPVTIRSEQDYNKELDKYSLELILSFNNFHL